MPPKQQRSIIPLMLRLPADLHRKLAQDAEKNGRSLNAEIVEQLMRPIRQEEESKMIELAAEKAATTAVNQMLKRVDFSSLPRKRSARGGGQQ